MSSVKLLDLDILLPSDVVLTVAEPQNMVEFYSLEGSAVDLARESIEAAGTALGYDLTRTAKASCLLRRGQRITLVSVGPSRVDVTIDDSERLPFAKTAERGITVGRISVELEGVRIVPRRERHGPQSTKWISEWEISGKDAHFLSSSILDSLATRGLRSGGTLAPLNADVGSTWHSEAYSAEMLIKVRARQEHDHVLLRLELVDTVADGANVGIPSSSVQGGRST
jgi:hypothetical protein